MLKCGSAVGELHAGTCQPVLDTHCGINSLLSLTAERVGKLTCEETPASSCSGVTGLMVTSSGGIGTRGRPRTNRSGLAS